MSDAIKVAIITGSVEILVALIVFFQASRKRERDEAVKEAKLEAKLNSIEKKLDEHNGYAVKIGSLEKSMVRLETVVTERLK